MSNYNYSADVQAFIENAPDKRITVEIGDTKDASKFYPQVKLMPWSNECNFSMRYAYSGEETPVIEEIDGVIKWRTSKVEAHFYDKVLGTDGGYEFEVILLEKPESNIIPLTLNAPKNLNFYYQGEINQEQIPFNAIRPDNVIGSYAVYHSQKGNMHKSGAEAEKYKTGKAFHIYRPEAMDANDNKVWCSLTLDIENQTASITIPQEFLDSAVYPVIVDPTFGYTAAGATPVPTYLNIYAAYNNAPRYGYLTQISAYVQCYFANKKVKYGVYKGTSLLGTTVEGTLPTSPGWVTLNLQSSINLTKHVAYLLGTHSNNEGSGMYYDQIPGYLINASSSSISYGVWPNPITWYYPNGMDSNAALSIYGTYVATEETINITEYGEIGDGLLTEWGEPLTGNVDGKGIVSLKYIHYVPQINSISSVSGRLWGDFKLRGSADTQDLSVGFLRRDFTVAGTAQGVSSLSGLSTWYKPLNGEINCQSDLEGILHRQSYLSGNIVGQSSLSGRFFRIIRLLGSPSGQSSISGVLHRLAGIKGNVLSQSSINAIIEASRKLGGSISGVSSLRGGISRQTPINGNIAALSSLSLDIDLLEALLLEGEFITSVTESGIFEISKLLNGIYVVEYSLDGTFDNPKGIDGTFENVIALKGVF